MFVLRLPIFLSSHIIFVRPTVDCYAFGSYLDAAQQGRFRSDPCRRVPSRPRRLSMVATPAPVAQSNAVYGGKDHFLRKRAEKSKRTRSGDWPRFGILIKSSSE